ncbi:MAG: mandelate racemase [Hyphomicrobium sp.]|nr:mandelate racemase [Hyphomicrobium sp.]
MIEDVRLDRLRLPLKEPYKLALGPVTAFDTIIARIVVNGREGLGEATILTGYTDETIDEAWPRAAALASRLVGLSSDAAKVLAEQDLEDAPFTLTAFVTAIEMAEGHPLLAIDADEEVPLLAGINATDFAGIEREIEAAVVAGYGTLKIKAGFDVEADLKRVAFIQKSNRGRAKLRLDANQGYSRAHGVRFASALAPESIELLEQPCHADDWKASAAIAAVSTVPLMLDESIYGLEDIKRAAALGASFVKLKLMKMSSLTNLAEGLHLVRDLGMQPVLGNGVASDLGCWMEACVARRTITNAGEMNGFLRQRVPIAATPIAVRRGSMQLEAGMMTALDDARIAAARVSQMHAGRLSSVK